MTLLRFAGNALKALYPGFAAGPRILSKASLQAGGMDLAGDLVPNLAFSVLAGTSLPGADPAIGFQGATMGDRLAASAADFAVSYPIGAASRLLGRGGARLAGNMRGQRFSPDTEGMIQNVVGPAGEAVFWASGMGANPVAQSVFDRYNQQAALKQEEDQRAYREAILAEERERVARQQQAVVDYGGLGAALVPFGFSGFGTGGIG